ncbi:MAG: hypothetical protein VX223_00190 [Myxococcota bacterium]|nr:hypothetical protein [Myxococcota bacterium]
MCIWILRRQLYLVLGLWTLACSTAPGSRTLDNGGIDVAGGNSDTSVIGITDTASTQGEDIEPDVITMGDSRNEVMEADSFTLPDDTVVTDLNEPEDTSPPPVMPLPDGLVGSLADQTFSPGFVGVVNQDSDMVDPTVLVGNWTVLWFYPFASTFG